MCAALSMMGAVATACRASADQMTLRSPRGQIPRDPPTATAAKRVGAVSHRRFREDALHTSDPDAA